MNLNVYRNLYFRSLSSQKNKFAVLAKKLINGMPKLGQIILHYDICPQTKRRLDVMNVGSIVDKYFSDVLTAEGVIIDDDYTRIPFVSFGFGGIIPKECAKVTITEVKPREDQDMKVFLDSDDIQTALDQYITKLGVPGATGAALHVSDDGEITAEVQIGAVSNTPAVTKSKTKNKGGRPVGSKNKPKDTEEVVIDDNAGIDGESSTNSSSSTDAGPSEAKSDLPFEPDSKEEETSSDNKPEGGKTKNLFGDKETSSSNVENSSKVVVEETSKAPTTGTNKSIFDVAS